MSNNDEKRKYASAIGPSDPMEVIKVTLELRIKSVEWHDEIVK
jgi:hypothetical protein